MFYFVGVGINLIDNFVVRGFLITFDWTSFTRNKLTKKYTELKTKNMMFNQPPTSEKMYFILSPLGEMDIPVHVAFDDAQTAEAYISRFKTYSDARIVECQLNPGFYTDITRDCYFVLINNYNDEYSIYLVNDLKGSEKALNREYFFKR